MRRTIISSASACSLIFGVAIAGELESEIECMKVGELWKSDHFNYPGLMDKYPSHSDSTGSFTIDFSVHYNRKDQTCYTLVEDTFRPSASSFIKKVGYGKTLYNAISKEKLAWSNSNGTFAPADGEIVNPKDRPFMYTLWKFFKPDGSFFVRDHAESYMNSKMENGR